jgi:hypothetical protein
MHQHQIIALPCAKLTPEAQMWIFVVQFRLT